jgi:GAF domain-containing protein
MTEQTVAELERKLQASRSELEESWAQQAAVAEVLQVINSSPGNLTPVFEAITNKAMRLCDAAFGGLWLVEGDKAHLAANINAPKAFSDFLMRRPFLVTEIFGNRPDRPFLHIVDLAATKAYRDRVPVTVAIVELTKARTLLMVPLFSKGAIVGIFNIYREEVRPFSDRQITLVQSFAAQAVLAIENARLLNETRDALEQKAATAEILKVINSSPGSLTPVFDIILEKATLLCGPVSAFFPPTTATTCIRSAQCGECRPGLQTCSPGRSV